VRVRESLGFSLPLVGRVGEGVDECFPNPLDNAIGLLQHVVVPKPQYSEAAFLEPRRAPIILLCCDRMLATVNFDR